MKLTTIYSIYNRTKLFKRGLKTVAWQTMNPADFELVIIDDGSSENIKKCFEPYIGKINIRYIRYDHKKHPIWQELNPDPTKEEHWYHTQAISANIGLAKAQGDIICIAQPEILHSPRSFQSGYDRAFYAKQIFGEIHWGTDRFNQWLDTNNWEEHDYDTLLSMAKQYGAEYEPNHMPDQSFYEMYWYVCYFPKAYAMAINGVDLSYQAGVYAEDDQFRVRMRMAGCEDKWGGRPLLQGNADDAIIGIHQSHMDEKKKYKKQDRDSQFWNAGAERNRNLWRMFNQNPYMTANEGLPYDWKGEFLIEKDEYYGIN